MLAPDVAPLLAGIERADSLAFDFHKWGQVPYDAGFLLVRDGARSWTPSPRRRLSAARARAAWRPATPWPCDFGPDLSRGFRALKTWFTFKTYGADAHRRGRSRPPARWRAALAQRVEAEPELELLAPVALNIVCFRYRCARTPNALNPEIVLACTTTAASRRPTTDAGWPLRDPRRHRQSPHRAGDIDALVDAVLRAGRAAVPRLPKARAA